MPRLRISDALEYGVCVQIWRQNAATPQLARRRSILWLVRRRTHLQELLHPLVDSLCFVIFLCFISVWRI